MPAKHFEHDVAVRQVLNFGTVFPLCTKAFACVHAGFLSAVAGEVHSGNVSSSSHLVSQRATEAEGKDSVHRLYPSLDGPRRGWGEPPPVARTVPGRSTPHPGRLRILGLPS